MKAAFAGALLLGLAGCSSAGPSIDGLRFVGSREMNGFELDFELGFSDPDGDLGLGFLRLSLDGRPMSQTELAPLFEAARPPLSLDARTGTVAPIVALTGNVVDGEQVQVRFQLVDKAQHTSEEALLVLEVFIDP